jgi:translocation and assembly module TamB
MKTVIRRGSIFLAAVVLLFAAMLAFVLGTEPGTRWALRQATQYFPGQLEIEEFRGTFLRGLEIPRLEYRNDSMRITAGEVMLRVSWIRSSLDRVYLSQISVGAFSYTSLAAPNPEKSPLKVSMPALPIWIGATRVHVGSLAIGEFEVTDIAAENAWLRGNRISAASVNAKSAGVIAGISELDTRLEGDVPLSASVAWTHENQQWSGEGTLQGSLAALGFSHSLSGAYPANASGTALLLNRIEPAVDAVVSFERWVFGALVIENGEVRISGGVDDYQAGFDVNVSDAQMLSATVAGEASGDRNGLDALALVADGPAGQLAVNGRLSWLPGFSTDVEVRALEFDPSQISGLATGRIDAVVQLQAEGVDRFSMQIDSLNGMYNGVPASARGNVSRDTQDWRCSGCEAVLGPNRIRVDGELNSDALAAQVDIDAPDLGLIDEDFGGALTANVNIRGSVAMPVVSGNASAANLSWNSWHVTEAKVASQSSTKQKVDLDISIVNLQRAESNFGGGSVKLRGELSAIDVSTQWTYGELTAQADAVVTVDGDDIVADVRDASLSEPFAGTWRLDDALRFSMLSQVISVTPHDWRNGDARLSLAEFRMSGSEIRVDASLQDMPLETVNAFLPAEMRFGGIANASLQLARDPGGELGGEFQWNQRDTVLRISPPGDEPIDVSIPVASTRIRLQGGGAEGEARLEIEPGVRGSLDASIDGFSADSTLTARVRLDGEEWAWISALLPEIDNFTGSISTDISASGRLSAPELRGELHWQDGRIAIPALNVPLENIDLKVVGSSAGSATISGSAAAGAGTLAVDGRFENLTRSDRSFTVQLRGTEATLLNWPDYQLSASPDLEFTGNLSGVRASGKVNVDRAEISVRELPEGAVKTSSDVSVSGREEEVVTQIPFSGEVTMVLSENVHISAFGLDTKVRGQLDFTLPEGREPRAIGELRLVDGVFGAYGQRLTIDEGTMTFTGPLDDPVIFVRAIREIESVSGTIRAGIELRGRAQNLSSTVFSSPSMSEADSLSYLVLGRPLEDATAADGNMLSGTAYALGLRQATVITSQIGQELGLDQLAVSGNNQSTTALVAGKQLNPKLYVRYAYGVFTQIGNLLLRYKLTRRLTIEAGTGAETQSMDLLYSVEKP